MKVAVLYTRVLRKIDPNFKPGFAYTFSEDRFLTTYIKYKPKTKHDMIVVDCGAEHQDRKFDKIAESYARYDESGYDTGCYQHVGSKLDHDLILCLNSHVHFWRDSWLEPFIKAHETFGPGVYGASGSFEEHPHIRTPVIAFCPGAIKAYPVKCDSRRECGLFEFGPRNFTLYSMSLGYPVRVVAADGFYYLYNSNQIKNGFRDGDQSNVLIWDRHTDYWKNETNQDIRRLYTNSAKTLKNGFPDSRLDQ